MRWQPTQVRESSPYASVSSSAPWVRAAALPGILDITPGVRSLQIHFNGRVLSRELLLEQVWDRAGQDQIERVRKLGVDVRQSLPAGYSTGGPECEPLKRL